MPLSAIVKGESEASLVMVKEPFVLPVPTGANVTVSVTIWSGAMTCPVDRPVILRPAPARLKLWIVTFEPPVFVRLTSRTLLRPTVTFPNVSEDELRLKTPAVPLLGLSVGEDVGDEPVVAVDPDVAGEFTTKVAGLLVTVPARLLIVTANCAPVAAAVSGGVV